MELKNKENPYWMPLKAPLIFIEPPNGQGLILAFRVSVFFVDQLFLGLTKSKVNAMWNDLGL